MYSETSNNVSIANLTPATDTSSAWDRAISFVDKLTQSAVGIYTADKASKVAEKQLDIQATIARNQAVNPSLAAATANNPTFSVSGNTQKIIIAGIVTLGVVVTAAILIRNAKK